jgi:hypothetical protein
MPPLPNVPNTLKLVFAQSTVGGAIAKGVNIFHLQYPGPLGFTATECVGIANGAMTWWSTHFKPLQNSGWQLNNVQVNALDGTGVFGVSTTAAIVGTEGSASLPPQCAICLSWIGAPSYRGGKPRTYMMGLGTARVLAPSSQLLAAAALAYKTAAVAAIADTSFSTVGGVVGTFGAVSYVSKTINPTPPHHRTTPLFWPFLTANVHERLDSQRRRSGKESLYPSV